MTQSGINQSLSDTITDIKLHHRLIKEADEKKHSAYLQAVPNYYEAANLLIKAKKQLAKDLLEKVQWPNDFRAIHDYYAQQAIALYEKGLALYNNLAVVKLKFSEQKNFINILSKLADTFSALNNPADTARYALLGLQECISLMRYYQNRENNIEKEFFTNKALYFGEFLKKAIEQRKSSITVEELNKLNHLAQFYSNLASSAETEQKISYLQQAITIYQTIINKHVMKKFELFSYKKLIEQLEHEINYIQSNKVDTAVTFSASKPYPDFFSTLVHCGNEEPSPADVPLLISHQGSQSEIKIPRYQ